MPDPTKLMTLLLLLALSACGRDAQMPVQQVSSPDFAAIDGVRPQAANWYASHTATAPLAAVAAAAVHAKTSGQVLEILAEEGDAVQKGQPLAYLDTARSRLQLQRVSAELSQSRNALARALTLAERGLVSRASVESLEFAVAELTAALELQQLELDYAVIRAPIAGVVAERAIRVGQQLAPDAAAFQITDTSRLLAELRIPQVELHRFSPGQPAEVRPDALPELSISATVDRLSPTIDPATGTFRLTVYVDNAQGVLAPGMFSRITIGYQKHENAMILPASAIKLEDGRHTVYVIRGERAELRAVTTGIWQGQQVEILNGLGFDEQVFRNASLGALHANRLLVTSAASAASGG
ncbi:MAG: efflux RND transporter periplasmic adaptor subunit [Woeseia sp.]